MISWEAYKKDFEWDDSFRDIYVFKTTCDDWRSACEHLSQHYKFEFQVDGIAQPFPASVEDVFAIRKQASPLLQFSAGNILVMCHFFTPDEIEFDIGARDITSQLDLDALLGFLRMVGDVVKKPVSLTPENVPECSVITYDPQSGKFGYNPTDA